MFVGEQPGESEDREGRPFVGPAGGSIALGQRISFAGESRTFVEDLQAAREALAARV